MYEAFESESERERVAVVKYLLALVRLLPVLYTAAAPPPATPPLLLLRTHICTHIYITAAYVSTRQQTSTYVSIPQRSGVEICLQIQIYTHTV